MLLFFIAILLKSMISYMFCLLTSFLLPGGNTLTPLVPINMQDIKIDQSLQDQTLPPYYTGKHISWKQYQE